LPLTRAVMSERTSRRIGEAAGGPASLTAGVGRAGGRHTQAVLLAGVGAVVVATCSPAAGRPQGCGARRERSGRSRLDLRRSGGWRHRAPPPDGSSRRDFQVAPELEEEATDVVAGVLGASEPSPDVVMLEGVPTDRRWPQLLTQRWRARRMTLHRQFTQLAPIVTLNGRTHEEWLGSKSRIFRQGMRRRLRQLEVAGRKDQPHPRRLGAQRRSRGVRLAASPAVGGPRRLGCPRRTRRAGERCSPGRGCPCSSSAASSSRRRSSRDPFVGFGASGRSDALARTYVRHARTETPTWKSRCNLAFAQAPSRPPRGR
jgi:hypothetical protein